MGCPKRSYDLTGRTVLVTGGTSGIGKATAVALARFGARVVITARDDEKGRRAMDDIRSASGSDAVEVMTLDLARLDSVRAFASAFADGHERLDVLVNNAGLVGGRRKTTVDGFETVFQTNHLGPFLLTCLLLDLLRASAPARVVNVASSSHKGVRLDPDDLESLRGPYIGLQVYARSKLANILFTRELARRLAGSGVTANAVHPGTVRSGFGLGGEAGSLLTLGLWIARWVFLSPQRAARRVVHVVAAPEVAARSGEYHVRCRPVPPSAAARDDEMARLLWSESERMAGLRA